MAALIVTLVAAIAAVSTFSGKLDARVAALESVRADTISRAEWNVFAQDVRDRLDRIESKLDKDGGK